MRFSRRGDQPVELLRVPLFVPEQCLQTTEIALLQYKQWHMFRDEIDMLNKLTRPRSPLESAILWLCDNPVAARSTHFPRRGRAGAGRVAQFARGIVNPIG